MKEGNLLEIFTSFQGEGVWAGVRQLFVRTSICHLRCCYCDTPESWGASKEYRVEIEPHSRRFETKPNPATVEEVMASLRRHLASGLAYHSISITGGEPLVQADFLEDLLPVLKRDAGLPIYLETSGTLSDQLARAAAWTDYFSLDFKPPSTPGAQLDWSDFRRCVEIARGKEAQVKMVVMQDTPTEDEVEACAETLRGSGIALIFTPVTEVNASCRAPDGDRLRRLREAALRRGIDPLVIPQIHPLVGWW